MRPGSLVVRASAARARRTSAMVREISVRVGSSSILAYVCRRRDRRVDLGAWKDGGMTEGGPSRYFAFEAVGFVSPIQL